MMPLYADYVNALKEDQSNLKKFFNDRFEWLDYRYLMTEKAPYKTTYIDNIHTNKLGNFLIANQILDDLKDSKCFKSYLDN